jgi:hypothetical protein
MSSYGRKVDDLIDEAILANKAKDIEVEYTKVSNNCGGCSTKAVSHREYSVSIDEAKDRKDTPVALGVLKYFPNAIKYVARVSKAGNDQHHPDKPLHWDRAKSTDELDALSRHLIDHMVEPVDTDGMLHLGKVAWRALAALEKHLEDA